MTQQTKIIVGIAIALNTSVAAILLAPKRVEYASVQVPAYLASHTSPVIQALGNAGWEIHSKHNYVNWFDTIAGIKNGRKVETWQEQQGHMNTVKRAQYDQIETVVSRHRAEYMVQFDLTRKTGFLFGRKTRLPELEGVKFKQASTQDFQ